RGPWLRRERSGRLGWRSSACSLLTGTLPLAVCFVKVIIPSFCQFSPIAPAPPCSAPRLAACIGIVALFGLGSFCQFSRRTVRPRTSGEWRRAPQAPPLACAHFPTRCLRETKFARACRDAGSLLALGAGRLSSAGRARDL